MANTMRKTVDRPTLLRLAADADADPRSVERALHGEHVRGRAGERIARALETNGFAASAAEAAQESE